MKKFILLLLLIHPIATALACNVPVFRYALERWDADALELAILHPLKKLTPKEQEAFDLLKKYSFDGDNAINLHLHSLTPETLPNHFIADFFEGPPAFQNQAILYLFHPRQSNLPGLIWKAPLTLETANELLYSSFRKKLSDSICSGTTLIWILAESGNPEKDSKAWETLQKAITEIPSTIEIPEGITLTDGSVTGSGFSSDPDSMLDSEIPLKIQFQALRMPQNGEKILMQTLSTGFELEESDEPRIYSFFGQGRCLDPLTGSEINARNFKSIARYLCGACSCEVKFQNPGIDLLMLCPWYKITTGQGDPVDYTLFQKTAPSAETISEKSPPKKHYIPIALILTATLSFFAWRSHRP